MNIEPKTKHSNNKMILHNQLARRKKPKEQLHEKVSEIFADLRKLDNFIPMEKESVNPKQIGNLLMDYGVPLAAGAATGTGAYLHGFNPFESAMLGLAGGAIADPKAYQSAWQNRLADPSLGGPVSGFFAGMKKPLMNKALLAGIGLAPGAAKSATGILHNTEKTTKDISEGTAGFGQTGQDIQKGISQTSKNLADASGSMKDLTQTIAPASQAVAQIPGILEGANSNIKKLFGVLAGAVGVTGAYLVVNRLAKLKERVEREHTKQTQPAAVKKKKITIDPGDYNIDFGSLVQPKTNTMKKAANYDELKALFKNAIQSR